MNNSTKDQDHQSTGRMWILVHVVLLGVFLEAGRMTGLMWFLLMVLMTLGPFAWAPSTKERAAQHSTEWNGAQWEQLWNWSGVWVRCTLRDGRSATAVRGTPFGARLAAFSQARGAA